MTKTLTEIATMALHLGKKTNKAEAFKLLTDAINAGEPLTDGAFAALYAFFIPSPVPAKKPFDWVQLACAKTSENRYYLQHVYVTDGRMVATNGHLLHALRTDLAEGFYDKAGTKIDVDATYPDFDRAIPADRGKTHVWERKSAELISSWMGSDGIAVHVYKLPNGTHVNKAYWDRATAGKDTVEFQNADAAAPVRVFFDDDDGKIAVIMPLRQ